MICAPILHILGKNALSRKIFEQETIWIDLSARESAVMKWKRELIKSTRLEIMMSLKVVRFAVRGTNEEEITLKRQKIKH